MSKPKNKRLKRANGTGSVYKLSGRRRRPWVAEVTTGWEINEETQTKKRLYDVLGYFEKEIDAKNALDKYRLIQEEPQLAKSTLTLEQVYNIWSKIKFAETISKETKDGYKASWKKLSPLHKRIFSEIRSDEFQERIYYYKDEKKMSESTLTKLKSLIYALCEYAYHNGILRTNYTVLIKIGNIETTTKKAFTEAEVNILKENINKIPWIDTVVVLCYTSMRPGEMLRLTKFSIDLKERLIRGGIKTDAGKDRVIPIHPFIYPIILKWYNKNGDTIFCDENGKALSVRAYRENRYRPALKEIGIRVLNPRACRRTFATMANRLEVSKANIQKIMGHVVGSDITDKVYTLPEIEDLRKTIEMFP